MGLDTTHNAWHGAYSSFNKFRFWLADRIGINLNEYAGYGNGTKDLRNINHDLMPLFNHSDCDGILTVDECKQIANGLKKVIDAVVPDNSPFNNYERAKQFMDGCLLAVSRNEEIEFR